MQQIQCLTSCPHTCHLYNHQHHHYYHHYPCYQQTTFCNYFAATWQITHLLDWINYQVYNYEKLDDLVSMVIKSSQSESAALMIVPVELSC